MVSAERFASVMAIAAGFAALEVDGVATSAGAEEDCALLLLRENKTVVESLLCADAGGVVVCAWMPRPIAHDTPKRKTR
jgi:hypothetical protein